MDITIKSAVSSDLPILNKYLPTNIPNFHEARIRDHEMGLADWLIAYEDTIPVGHFLVRWDGCHNAAVRKFVYDCPHLESGGVIPKYRKQGIATKLIKTAEEMAVQKGFKQIGMAVGATDNPGSRHLYESLGYKEWDNGTFEEAWAILNQNGNETTEIETCTYLIKLLNTQ